MPLNKARSHFSEILRSSVAGAALSAILCFSLPLWAANAPEDEAARIQSEIEAEQQRSRDLEAQAQTLSHELEQLRQQLVTAAQDTQERENLIANIEVQIMELQAETELRQETLAERHRQLTGTLAALTGLSEDAPRAFFLYPGPPLDAVRGSILLQAAAPAIGRRAAVLREDLAALDAVRSDLNAKLAQLSSADQALAGDREHLQQLLEKKKALYQRTAAESQAANERLKRLGEKAESLKDLMAALEQERISREAEEAERRKAEAAAQAAADAQAEAQEAPPEPDNSAQLAALAAVPTQRPEGIRAFPDSGAITAPAVGVLVQQYGQDTGYGQTAKGIEVETRANATVLAPYDGHVVFAGPFRDLGLVLIIEHDGGYHTVLAGFARIDVGVGHWILAGEPIGQMPQTHLVDANASGSQKTSSGGRPRLYMELRRGGQPVNPLRWLTAGSIRMNG
ncbi:peptidoglycan DD-metalloendopeptidase family protein [Rhodospirillaceae bacterium KN72]|uniref:Peptidoglycan DD-metalloendopeptidase family protein n=1 Tax=Pacificispira spongiicola TaxID=2729598 RepID=A0A7Y0E1Y7_9PROT|nr:peptidoglycan DD-metalloendopeptidase family protein [Pacificispira spongiicola]NMM45734.1 peptidoglycan DD-metalloendopeptidase family protein [Pacificispira spongiicola]